MRQQQSVDLGDGNVAIIKELDVLSIWKMLPLLKNTGDEDIDLLSLFEEKWQDLLPILMPCVELPEGVELGYGDFENIALAFLQVNQSFLDRASKLLGIDLSALASSLINKSKTSGAGA